MMGRFNLDIRPNYKQEISRLIKLSEFYYPYMKKIFKHLQKYTENMKTIIDIGAGTGHTTMLLKEIFPDAEVTYFDISKKLTTYAKIHFENIDKFISGDIFDFKFTKKYDLVFSRYVIKHLFDPKRAIEIFSQILNENGIICLIDKDVSANIWYPFFPLYKTKFMNALNKYNERPTRGGDAFIGRKMKSYLNANNIAIMDEDFLLFDLTSRSNLELRKLYVEVYKNLLPELVKSKLLDLDQGKKDIEFLENFLSNSANTAISIDFILTGLKK